MPPKTETEKSAVKNCMTVVGKPQGESFGIEWYERKLSRWELYARMLRTLQIVLAVIAITSAVLASSKLGLLKSVPDGLLSTVAAVSIALAIGLDLSAQANKHRGAWRTLNFEMLKYKNGLSTLACVHEAYERAENAVGEYVPSYTQ
jgi:hypothetical protein